ncbi:MAG: regulatory protein RecX [Kangiellaceae bacterium]
MKSSQKAINSACRMLGIREHSEKQLRVKLRNKGFTSEDIDLAIKFLFEQDWLSNERFCEAFIRSRVAKGQGRKRIEFELQQNGIGQALINLTLSELDIDWQHECSRVLEKKIATTCKEKEVKFEEKIKIERFMRYKGFEPEQIKSAFASSSN